MSAQECTGVQGVQKSANECKGVQRSANECKREHRGTEVYQMVPDFQHVQSEHVQSYCQHAHQGGEWPL